MTGMPHVTEPAPIIHLNGTPKERLLEGYRNALDALQDAGKALAQTAPHMRDFYVNPDRSAFAKADDAHGARLRKLATIINEIEELAEAVWSQGNV